jgi:hypothetical protein
LSRITIRGDSFRFPISPMAVMLCLASVLGRKKRAIHCAVPPSSHRCSWLMPCWLEKPIPITTASTASQAAIPNRRERSGHKAHAIKTTCPQK